MRSAPVAEVARDAAMGPKRRRPAKDTEAAAAAERGRRISAAGEAANLETAAAALHAMAKTLIHQPRALNWKGGRIGVALLLDWTIGVRFVVKQRC
jgi:hypothetical protein